MAVFTKQATTRAAPANAFISVLFSQRYDITKKRHTGDKGTGTTLKLSLTANGILLVITANIDHRIAAHTQCCQTSETFTYGLLFGNHGN